ncbi:hypothetical protein CR513_27869, partial [Mucuna pruriens]
MFSLFMFSKDHCKILYNFAFIGRIRVFVVEAPKEHARTTTVSGILVENPQPASVAAPTKYGAATLSSLR